MQMEAAPQKFFADLEPGDRLEVSGTASITVGLKTGRRTRVTVEAAPEVTIAHVKTGAGSTPFRRG